MVATEPGMLVLPSQSQHSSTKSKCHGRGQCTKMCCILDVDGVDVSEVMRANVSLLTFVLKEASGQTGLARSKRMLLITQGI